MSAALLVVAAYFIGAFPSSYVVAKLVRGIDLRQHGSGNLGATNAYRVLGWRPALPIFVLDIAKGWFPTAFFPVWDGMPAAEWALAYGTAAIVGHVFSIYVGFRGGKGVATSAGVLIALSPVAALIGFVVWATVLKATGYVSLASIIAAAVVPVVTLLFEGPFATFWLTIALALFVIWSHRSNIRRLMAGNENRFGRHAGESG